MNTISPKIIFILWDLDDSSKKIISKTKKNSLLINIQIKNKPPNVKNRNFINIVHSNPIATASQISSFFDLIEYDTWIPLNLEKIDNEHDEIAQIIFRKLSEFLNSKIMIRNTVLNQTINFIKNVFLNAPITNNKINLIDFHNNFSNKPFLIVAAGPSLDKQLDIIKEYQENFYIIAVDKAYPSIAKKQIIPDFVITIDPKSTPSWPQNSLNERTIFINDIGSNPDISWSNNKNHLFISCQSQVTSIAEYFGLKSDMLETGGSVATSAFSFAYMCGANPIVLVGQDLAYTDNKDHAADYINSYGTELINKKIESGYSTESYYGGDISTCKQFLMYKSWYEAKFARINDKFIFNCTEGGANIKGALNIPLKALCEELKKTNNTKIPLLNSALTTTIDTKIIEVINMKIDKVKTNLENMKALIEKTMIQMNERKRLTIKTNNLIEDYKKYIAETDDELKLFLSKFNQIDYYNLNRLTIREEHKTSKDLMSKYNQFFSTSIKSIDLCLEFLNKIKESYIEIKNRAEISSDSIVKIKSNLI